MDSSGDSLTPANFRSQRSFRLPFSELPRVERVSALTNSRPEDSVSETDFFVAFFDRPAHFARPIPFSPTVIDHSDGVLIHEGMTVAVRPKGEYELHFIVRSPPVPLKLRISLNVLNREFSRLPLPAPEANFPAVSNQKRNSGIFAVSKIAGEITIPDISLIPTETERQSRSYLYWKVSHRGYSTLLEKYLSAADKVDSVRMLRAGSVRYVSERNY